MIQILFLLWIIPFYKYFNFIRKNLFFWFVLHYIFLIVIMGLFYPSMDLDSTVDTTQEISIRFLASFCYMGDSRQYWSIILVIIFAFFTLISLLIFNFNDLDDYKQINSEIYTFFKKFILLQLLLYYFYWIFMDKYSPKSLDLILIKLRIWGFVHIIIILSNLLLFIGLLKLKENKLKSTLSFDTEREKNPIVFECPYCKTQYNSNIKYCVKCKKEI
jgi:hypothetical protein